MDIPALPTDNLYKFLFVFGITMVIFSQYLSIKNNSDYANKSYSTDSTLTKLEIYSPIPKFNRDSVYKSLSTNTTLTKQDTVSHPNEYYSDKNRAINKSISKTFLLKYTKKRESYNSTYTCTLGEFYFLKGLEEINQKFHLTVIKVLNDYKNKNDFDTARVNKLLSSLADTTIRLTKLYVSDTTYIKQIIKDVNNNTRLRSSIVTKLTNDVSYFREINNINVFLRIAGIIAFISGGILWYIFTQRPQDKLLRYQYITAKLDLTAKRDLQKPDDKNLNN